MRFNGQNVSPSMVQALVGISLREVAQPHKAPSCKTLDALERRGLVTQADEKNERIVTRLGYEMLNEIRDTFPKSMQDRIDSELAEWESIYREEAAEYATKLFGSARNPLDVRFLTSILKKAERLSEEEVNVMITDGFKSAPARRIGMTEDEIDFLVRMSEVAKGSAWTCGAPLIGEAKCTREPHPGDPVHEWNPFEWLPKGMTFTDAQVESMRSNPEVTALLQREVARILADGERLDTRLDADLRAIVDGTYDVPAPVEGVAIRDTFTERADAALEKLRSESGQLVSSQIIHAHDKRVQIEFCTSLPHSIPALRAALMAALQATAEELEGMIGAAVGVTNGGFMFGVIFTADSELAKDI